VSVLITDAGGEHALAVIRSLGRRGIRVVAADSTRWTRGGFSRFCTARAVYPSPVRGVREFREGLGRLIDVFKPEILLPMTLRTILAMTPVRREIESRVRLAPLPSEESLSVAADRRATIGLAASLGLAVPHTVVLRDPADLAVLRSILAYPVVIKPRSSESPTAAGGIALSGSPEYCPGPDELSGAYLSVHRRAPSPLIQEFIPGDGYGISALYDRGRLKALFAHRRRPRPGDPGGALGESVAPPPDMVEPARALLEALQWHGAATVEFKRDARDGRPRLMQIDGRLWNSLPLAVASGIDVPFLLYTLALEGTCPERFDYRVGIRGRSLAADAQRLLWLTDPVPFVAGIAGAALRSLDGRASPRRAPALEGASEV